MVQGKAPAGAWCLLCSLMALSELDEKLCNMQPRGYLGLRRIVPAHL